MAKICDVNRVGAVSVELYMVDHGWLRAMTIPLGAMAYILCLLRVVFTILEVIRDAINRFFNLTSMSLYLPAIATTAAGPGGFIEWEWPGA